MITPFYLGFLAALIGTALDDSPYRYCSIEDIEWIVGWQSAGDTYE